MTTAASLIGSKYPELRNAIKSLSDLPKSSIFSDATMTRIHELKAILELELEQLEYNEKTAPGN